MPEYMCLLYGPETDEEGEAERWAELPLWTEITASLRDAGVLIANNPLHPVQSATTVRVRDREVELTDGPFAVTKEVLAGYYLLECRDLDEALRHAARFPTARYGSVEVRAAARSSACSSRFSSSAAARRRRRAQDRRLRSVVSCRRSRSACWDGRRSSATAFWPPRHVATRRGPCCPTSCWPSDGSRGRGWPG